ncbi:MAG: sigma-70 family RNA polymerase sigma factor [Anaerolinea sp.]|nr:sigma-70 family RNA polymerase sigma factor [Anaerolinea sp.]CAG0973878.1 ECF RNA polymerase sigma factor SigD [Anaerolineae bacterium]
MALILPEVSIEDSLLTRIRRGDQAVVGEIYEQFFSSLYQYVRLRIEDTQQAEDITAEVFLKLLGVLGTARAPREHLRGWLFQVARHEIFRHYGKHKKFPLESLEEWLPSGEDVESETIRNATIEQTRWALRRLPAEQQEVLILRFSEGLDLQATADVMGKSLSAVKSLQFRATEALRGVLGMGKGRGRE